MAGPGGNDVEVKFGGSTADLDAASNKAANDIKKVGQAGEALPGVFGRIRSAFSSMTSNFRTNFSAEFAKNLQEAGMESMSFRDAVKAAFSDAGNSIDSFVGGMGRKIGVIATVLTGAMVGVGKWAAGFGDAAEKIDQMSMKLAMSHREVSQWSALATTAGMSADAFASSGTRLSRAMLAAQQGSMQQSLAFKQLGIEITKTSTTSQVMMQMADKFSTMADGPLKTSMAMQTMGRAGANLIPILNQGSKAIQEQFAMAEEYGAVVSDSFMDAGLAVDNAMDEMSLGMQGLKNMLFEALAPAVVVVTEAFNNWIKAMVESYRSGGAVKTILSGISGAFRIVATVIITVATGFRQLYQIASAALTGILGTIYSVGTALAKLLSGDFSGMKAAWSNGMKATGNAIKGNWKEIQTAQGQYVDGMHKLWGKKPLGGTSKPGEGTTDDVLQPPKKGGGDDAKKKAAEARRIAEEELRAFIEDINYKQDALKDDFAATMLLEQQKLDRIKAFYGEGSREYIRALREKEKKEREHQQEMIRLQQQTIVHQARLDELRLSNERASADASLASERQKFEALDRLGKVSNSQRIAALQDFATREAAIEQSHQERIYSIQRSAIQQQLDLAELPLQQQIALKRDLEVLEIEHQGRMARIRADADLEMQRTNELAAQQTLDRWTNIISPIEGAFNSFLGSMLTRSQSFSQALINMADQILLSFVQMGVQALAKWAALELAKTSATTAGVATRTAAEASGAATSNALSLGSALKQIAHKAGVAAAGAYAAIAGIPIVGPFLAPAAAAAALFGVMKLATSIFSAKDGEGNVPYDGAMYQLHKNEMVLPAKFANPLRDMLTGAGPKASMLAGNASAAGADARSQMAREANRYEFNYRPNHTNMDAGFETLLRRDGREFRKWLKRQSRNGVKLNG